MFKVHQKDKIDALKEPCTLVANREMISLKNGSTRTGSFLVASSRLPVIICESISYGI
ncbi:MAG: hypothetical protein WB975_04490 [Nitrososphaeraceae archaeon]